MSPGMKQFLESVDKPARRSGGPRPRVRGMGRTQRRHLTPIEIAVDDASRRASSGEWSGARGSTFVGLYAVCHRMVYGVLPGELDQLGVFRAAAKYAARMAHEDFADNPSAVAEFLRWAWEREKSRDAWARSKCIERNRLGWRVQFSRSLVTDYRVAKAKRR